MQYRPFYLAATILSSMTLSAAANAAVSSSDFVKKVSASNQFEIQSSQLALDKSHNKAVEDFAQMIVDDHTETASQLSAALDESTIKTEPMDDVNAKQAKQLVKLDATSGVTFDREYIALQTKAHKEAVALFSDYAANGKDPALQNFAKTTLPALKQHLKHVQKLSIK